MVAAVGGPVGRHGQDGSLYLESDNTGVPGIAGLRGGLPALTVMT